MRKRVSLTFLGCPKNFVDSEAILANLLKSNFELVDKVEKSEIAILTTCAFIKKAREEAYKKLRELVSLKKKGILKKIVCFGCLVQQLREGLLKRFPEVDHFVGLDYIPHISSLLKSKTKMLYKEKPTYLSFERLLQTSSYAYLKISEGCSNFCAYCRIPYIRGTYRSRPMEEIIREAKEISRTGIREIIIVSQDSTLYGKDIYSSPSLHLLLREMAKIPGIEWIRILYAHPAHIYPALLEVIKSEPKVLKYIDLPIQHISDRILSLMRRGYSKKDVLRIIAKLKDIPGMVIRTTFIVGFPGERERDFNELLKFIWEKRFDHVGCFPYSREKGTFAYSLPCQIPDKVKEERRRILLECQREISCQKLKSLIGQEMAVLIDEKNHNETWQYKGRTYRDAPEIDGSVLVKSEKLEVGKIYPLKITGASDYDLIAESPLIKP